MLVEENLLPEEITWQFHQWQKSYIALLSVKLVFDANLSYLGPNFQVLVEISRR